MVVYIVAEATTVDTLVGSTSCVVLFWMRIDITTLHFFGRQPKLKIVVVIWMLKHWVGELCRSFSGCMCNELCA